MKSGRYGELSDLLQLIIRKIDHMEIILANLPKDSEKNEELLTINQASKLLNLSVSTLYSKVSRNEIPVNKVGKRLYFYRSELSQWIRSGRIKTSTEIRREVEDNFKKKH